MQRLVSSFKACLASRSDSSKSKPGGKGTCDKSKSINSERDEDYIAEIEEFLLIAERLLIPAKHIGSKCAPYQQPHTALLSTKRKQDAQVEIDMLIEESVRVFSGDTVTSPSKAHPTRSGSIEDSEEPEAAPSPAHHRQECISGFELFSVADRGSFIEYSRLSPSVSPFLVHVPREIVYRSTVLKNALCDTSDGTDCLLLLPIGVLRAWVLSLDFLSIRRIHKTNVEDIMQEGSVGSALRQFLQAADFLDDQNCLETLRDKTAQWLFQAPETHDHSMATICSERVQIVEDMPNHLFRPILAASKRSLLFQLTNLPERLHLHALDASHPSIAATSTLQICITRQREQSTLLAPLVSKLTSLESLSLRLAGGAPAYAWMGNRFIHQVARSFKHLTSLTNLELYGIQMRDELTIQTGCGLAIAVVELHNAIDAIAWNLRWLSNLRVLSLAGCSIEARGACSLAGSRCFSMLPHLTKLELADNGIEELGAQELVPRIADLTNLRFLGLKSNMIGDRGVELLSSCFTSWKSLEHLDISGNVFGSRGLSSLAASISDLGSLTGLCLGGANFSQCSSVREFMTVLPTALPQLHTLVASWIGPSVSSMPDLAAHISRLTTLEVLVFTANSYSTGSIEMLLPPIGKLTNLQRLDLDSNPFDGSQAASLGESLSKLTCLTSLCLKECFEVEGSVARLARSFRALENLQKLYLHRNNINVRDAEALIPNFCCFTNLQELTLAETRIENKGASLLIDNCNLSTLQCLDLNDTRMHDFGEALFNWHISRLTNLTKLGLGANDLSFKSVAILANRFSGLTALKDLTIRVRGRFHELAPSVCKIHGLTNLDFSGCQISSEGAQVFSNHIVRLTSLKRLALKYTTLDTVGMKWLAPRLGELPNLEVLDLALSRYTEAGLRYLLPYLGRNPFVTRVGVDNRLSSEALEILDTTHHNIELYIDAFLIQI